MSALSALKVTVAEAQDTGNAIGKRCMKIAGMEGVPVVAKVLAKTLLDGWVATARSPRKQDKNGRGDGGHHGGGR